jgi:tRNA (cmo5U34)-methyltransferase
MAKSDDDKLRVISSAAGDKAGQAGRERDNLFAKPRTGSKDFQFNADTAKVFDDMVSRSVPFYAEIQRMVGELVADFAQPGTSLYDLGCATGTTFLALDGMVDPRVQFIGVDNSDDMLEKARAKLAGLESKRDFELINADLHTGPVIENASVVILLLTLQFVRPLYRERMLGRIHAGLRKNGCLILVEKLTCPSTLLNRSFIKYYYEYKKRNGYSEMEIAQKREALENVLIPYRYRENEEMLARVGFDAVEEFFRWYNFCGIVAVKQ